MGFSLNNLNKIILGGIGDPIQFIWGFKWFAYAVVHGLNPFISFKILNPAGINIAWSSGNSFTADLLFLPVTLIFGAVTSYNLFAVLSPALSAFAVFILCMYITKKHLPSIIGGYIYGFSSYETGQIGGHLNLITIFLIPIIILFSLMFFQNKIKKIYFITLISLLLILQFGFSLEIFTTMTFFGYISLIIMFIMDKKNRKQIISLIAYITLSYIITFIVLSPFIYYLYTGLPFTPKVFNSTTFFSSDLLNYIIPTPNTWFGSNLFSHISSKFTGNFTEEGAYIGLPLIILFFIYLKDNYKQTSTKILSIIILVIFISSFGPFLHIMGYKIIPMPWHIMTHMPFIKQALPTRFPLYISLVLAIITALFLSESRRNIFVKYSIAFLGIIILIPNISALGIFWGAQSKIDIPKFFTQKIYLKQYIKKDSNVLIIPYGYMNNNYSSLWQAKANMYFNTVDNSLGYIPIPLNIWPWLHSNIVHSLNSDTPDYRDRECMKGFLESNNIRKVILSNDEYKKWGNIFNKILEKPLFVGGIVLYKVPEGIISKYNKLGYKLISRPHGRLIKH
ncbi:MAG: hypothetical protein ACYCSW_10585 [bacterium]